MVAMAGAVGATEDAAKYKALGGSMRTAFKAAFYNSTLQRYAPRTGADPANELLLQSLNVAPLAVGRSAAAAADAAAAAACCCCTAPACLSLPVSTLCS